MADLKEGEGAGAALWTAEDARKAAQGRLEGAADWTISGLTIDSRLVEPGDLFIALKDKRDGHDFVAAALKAGAKAALVSRRPDNVDADAPLLVVPDTLAGLAALARARRAETQARIVGVTGSVGKTSSKEMLHLALSESGPTHAPVKSFNNHIGVPLTLARMPAASAYGVFEIGMNHAGEITPLSQLVAPHVAIVTTVAPVHIEFFASLDGIAEAKAEIFAGVVPGGTAIINGDIEHSALLGARARDQGIRDVQTFGTRVDCDARLAHWSGDDMTSDVEADLGGERLRYRIGAPGKHLAMNSLAVLMAVKALGADLKAAADALGHFHAGAGRGARHDLTLSDGPVVLLDESYNANPASVAAALATLGRMPVGPGGRRIAVLGDMLELGDDAGRYHARVSEAVEENAIDLVFCAGPLMRHLWDSLPAARRGAYAEQSAGLIGPVLDALRGGDVITVKGSLGSKMRPVVDELLAKHLKQGEEPSGGSELQSGTLRSPVRGHEKGA